MDFSTLGNHVVNPRLFKGPREKPFLAPRGLAISGDMMFVSDTGQNRVLVWKQIPSSTYANPDIVLGQHSMATVGRNADQSVAANTLHYPSGVWSNGDMLIVADAWNHRVLIWHSMPMSDAQRADVVLGQPDFNTNLPNVRGVGADPTSGTLNWPYGVFSDSKHLWVADTGNRRILYFDNIPSKNYAKADKVIGQPDFVTRHYKHDYPVWPYSVRVDASGRMLVADTQSYRILLWSHWEEAVCKKADIIIGQFSFDEVGQNQFRMSPAANTLNWTYDVCFYKEGMLVNDTGNSRILGFHHMPTENNVHADYLIGRPDFNTGSEFTGNLLNTQKALYWPFSMAVQQDTLFVADTGNHRLVIGGLRA